MAVALLPGLTFSCVQNCGTGKFNDVCEMGMGMASRSSNSLAPAAAVSEAGPSFRNFPVFGPRAVMPASVSGRSFCCCQSGAIYFHTSLSSRRYRHDGGEATISWSYGREARLKASATKDSSRDVFLSTDSHDPPVSHRRLQTPMNGGAEEDIDVGGGEKVGKESSSRMLLEQERSDTESSTSTSEGANSADGSENEGNSFGNSATIGTVAASLGLIVTLGGFGTVGFLYKDQINDFVLQFSDIIEGYGPASYGIFVIVYAVLELIAIPAIPLTMSAGLLFGSVIGTVVVSIAGTIAATGAFLIARYLLRNRLLEWAKGNKKFLAIDKAIGDDGFRVVTLLRLSPLLPFSLGNYLYGLTSVKLGPYVIGSWLGMLPGSWAYVSAGAIGRSFIIKQESEPAFSGGPEQLWTLGLGLAVTAFAATYVTRIAKDALKDIEN